MGPGILEKWQDPYQQICPRVQNRNPNVDISCPCYSKFSDNEKIDGLSLELKKNPPTAQKHLIMRRWMTSH